MSVHTGITFMCS